MSVIDQYLKELRDHVGRHIKASDYINLVRVILVERRNLELGKDPFVINDYIGYSPDEETLLGFIEKNLDSKSWCPNSEFNPGLFTTIYSPVRHYGSKQWPTIVSQNLMEDKDYAPYCGSCDTWGRARFNGEQFECFEPYCDWVSNFDEVFIDVYKLKWEMKGGDR